jgi:hypothetical protein
MQLDLPAMSLLAIRVMNRISWGSSPGARVVGPIIGVVIGFLWHSSARAGTMRGKKCVSFPRKHGFSPERCAGYKEEQEQTSDVQ